MPDVCCSGGRSAGGVELFEPLPSGIGSTGGSFWWERRRWNHPRPPPGVMPSSPNRRRSAASGCRDPRVKLNRPDRPAPAKPRFERRLRSPVLPFHVKQRGGCTGCSMFHVKRHQIVPQLPTLGVLDPGQVAWPARPSHPPPAALSGAVSRAHQDEWQVRRSSSRLAGRHRRRRARESPRANTISRTGSGSALRVRRSTIGSRGAGSPGGSPPRGVLSSRDLRPGERGGEFADLPEPGRASSPFSDRGNDHHCHERA